MASAEKMNWIYEGVSGMVDKEEYLTGRKVDKTFEIAQFEKDGGNVSDFNFQESNVPSLLESSTSNLSKLDLDIRMKEDPLQEIKRKQANIIKETLTNPIKMRRIKQLLEESLRKEKEEKRARKKLKKLKKKAKKLKKERKRSVSRSSSDSVDRARDQHKRRAEDEELPKRIKRERRDYSDESSGSRQASKLNSRKRENEETNSKARSKHSSSTATGSKYRVSKRDDFSKPPDNERLKVKQERRSVNRDRSASASRKHHRSSRRRSESSGSCSSGSSVNYSSSASSRSSSVSSDRDSEHRSRSQSIVRNSRNRRRSSSGSESRVKRRSDNYRSDHRSSRDQKSEKYGEHKSTKDRHGDRHPVKFDDRYRDRYRDHKPKDKLRERSRERSSRERPSAKMQADEWPEDERDMIPVIRSPVSIDPLKLARPCRKERQEQKNRRLFETGQYDSIEKSELNSLVDGVITSRYNTNFNQNSPKYNNYDPNDEFRNSKRQRAKQDDDSRGGRKKPNRSDDEREMEAKRKQMMANAEWRETQRSKDVEMHVREYEQEAAEIQSNLNKKYSARYH